MRGPLENKVKHETWRPSFQEISAEIGHDHLRARVMGADEAIGEPPGARVG